MDDSFLINQVKNGNKNAFKLLVIRYQRTIFSFLGNFQFPYQIIEDLAQETFLRAYKSLSSYDPQKGASFSSWLFTIAKNLALTSQKKKSFHSEELREDLEKKKDSSTKSPPKKLELQNIKNLVRDAIRKLPQQFQTAVILSYFDELTLEEIAEIENCPIGTVKSRIFRGKRILRNILQKEGVL